MAYKLKEEFEVEVLPIDDFFDKIHVCIVEGFPLRDLDQKFVEELTESIARSGLKVPIIVDNEGCVVDGVHRFHALKALKEAGVEIDVPIIRLRNASLRQDRLKALGLAFMVNRVRLGGTDAQFKMETLYKLLEDIIVEVFDRGQVDLKKLDDLHEGQVPLELAREVAKYIGVSEKTVWKYIRELIGWHKGSLGISTKTLIDCRLEGYSREVCLDSYSVFKRKAKEISPQDISSEDLRQKPARLSSRELRHRIEVEKREKIEDQKRIQFKYGEPQLQVRKWVERKERSVAPEVADLPVEQAQELSRIAVKYKLSKEEVKELKEQLRKGLIDVEKLEEIVRERKVREIPLGLQLMVYLPAQVRDDWLELRKTLGNRFELTFGQFIGTFLRPIVMRRIDPEEAMEIMEEFVKALKGEEGRTLRTARRMLDKLYSYVEDFYRAYHPEE